MDQEDEAQAAARLLLQARACGQLLAALPEACAPRTAAAAIAIQRRTMAELGTIGGWKVGATGPDATPTCAPMPASGIHPTPATLDAARFPSPFAESEIAFLLAHDLPPRGRPYGAEEVTAAIASCHPAIELVQSRFADPDSAGPLANLADLIRHGAFVCGEPIEDWRTRDFATLSVEQTIEGGPVRTGTGNPAGDMTRLLLWLANDGAQWAGGLRAGQIVTCGSWTGMTQVPAGAAVATRFAGAAAVFLRLASV
jgi:2-keto-4-pentenoate hydratase